MLLGDTSCWHRTFSLALLLSLLPPDLDCLSLLLDGYQRFQFRKCCRKNILGSLLVILLAGKLVSLFGLSLAKDPIRLQEGLMQASLRRVEELHSVVRQVRKWPWILKLQDNRIVQGAKTIRVFGNRQPALRRPGY